MHYTPQERRDLIAKGKCPACLDNFPLVPGKTRCARCGERARVNKRAYCARHGFGKLLCWICGKVPPAPGLCRCESCRTRDNAMAKRRAERRKMEHKCVKCGRKLNENELVIGKKTCFSCVEKVIRKKLI